MIKPILEKLMRRENLTRQEAAQLLDELLAESAGEAEIAAALTALAMKGETAEELVGFAETMRTHALKVDSKHDLILDTAGTGGSRKKTFNVSTAAALVIAAADVPVAKHGNRAVSSSTGSADVLKALNVRIDLPLEQVQRCLDQLGFCFLFAPAHHRATARVAQVRRRLGVRTIFNLLGPLTNPAGAKRQIVGVSDPATVLKMGQALSWLGAERAWVVHGEDGLDEVTLSGTTHVVDVCDGEIRQFEINPEEIGLARQDTDSLRASTPEESAATIREVLTGRRQDAARELVLLNAAAGLVVAGRASEMREGLKMAADTIDSGRAGEKLEAVITLTNEAS
jgi:anthranilate phosphoribosyltransferase